MAGDAFAALVELATLAAAAIVVDASLDQRKWGDLRQRKNKKQR